MLAANALACLCAGPTTQQLQQAPHDSADTGHDGSESDDEDASGSEDEGSEGYKRGVRPQPPAARCSMLLPHAQSTGRTPSPQRTSGG